MSEVTKCDCLKAFSCLDDYLDRELTAEEMDLVGRHIETCKVCAKEFTFEEKVLQTVKEKLRRIDTPKNLRENVLRAIQNSE